MVYFFFVSWPFVYFFSLDMPASYQFAIVFYGKTFRMLKMFYLEMITGLTSGELMAFTYTIQLIKSSSESRCERSDAPIDVVYYRAIF